MLNIYLTYRAAIPLLGTYPREMKVYMIIPRPACKHSLQYYSQYTNIQSKFSWVFDYIKFQKILDFLVKQFRLVLTWAKGTGRDQLYRDSRKLLRVMEMFRNLIVVSWVCTCVMGAHMHQNSSDCTFYVDTISFFKILK